MTTAIVTYFLMALGGLLTIIGIIWALCALAQIYGVWSSKKDGEASLAEAQNEEQIQVASATARLKAAELNKQADIIEAEAVSKSVEIIGKALENNKEYLQWQWIQMMEKRDAGDTIYVPTEASLPILEAGKRATKVEVDDGEELPS